MVFLILDLLADYDEIRIIIRLMRKRISILIFPDILETDQVFLAWFKK